MNALNVAEAKRHFTSILGRVAYGGRPMAQLLPAEEAAEPGHVGAVGGRLEDDDPFFAAGDEMVAGRARHHPRILAAAPPAPPALIGEPSGGGLSTESFPGGEPVEEQ